MSFVSSTSPQDRDLSVVYKCRVPVTTRYLQEIRREKMSEEKSLRVIPFSGKRSDWDGWSEKMLAKMEWLGCRKLLLCEKNEEGYDVVPTKETIDEIEEKSSKNADDKKILKLQELNKIAYMHLVMSIDTSTHSGKPPFRLIKNTKTKVYPDGNCKLAWDRLVAKYARKTVPSLMKLKKAYENSKLENREIDPDDWISLLEMYCVEIEAIDASSAISEKDLKLHILNNLPPEYDCVLDDMENRLDATGDDELTLEHIRDKLSGRFQRIKKELEEKRAAALYPDGQGAYAAISKQFKGTCNKCGKYGHKSAQCRDDQQFDRKCWFCGMEGHRMFKCEKFIAAKESAKAEEVGNHALDDDESYDELGL